MTGNATTSDEPTAPQGRETEYQQPHDSMNTIKVKQN